VELKRISLTVFRSCTYRLRYRERLKQTTRISLALDSISAHLLFGNLEGWERTATVIQYQLSSRNEESL
ncbi:hypothetical protein Tco_1152700, partial [Tanacetum coccineum]